MAGQTVSTLKFMITADAGGLVDGVALAKNEIREARKYADAAKPRGQELSERASLLANAFAQNKLTTEEYAAATGKLRQEMLAGVPVVGEFLASMTPVTLATSAAATAVTVLGGAVAFTAAVVAERTSALDDLGDAAQRLGLSASALSQLRGAAFLGDVDPALTDSIVQKMLVNIGKESDAFVRLGLDAKQLAQLDPASAIRDVARAINELPTKADRMSAMAEIFGKTGPEAANLIENFDRLSREAMQSGAVASQEIVDAAGEIDDKWKSIKLSTEGWANVLFGVSAGPLKTMATGLDELLKRPARAVDNFLGYNSMLSFLALEPIEQARNEQARRASIDAVARNGLSLSEELGAAAEEFDKKAMERENAWFMDRIKAESDWERELTAAAHRDAMRFVDEEIRAEQELSRLRVADAIRDIDNAERIKRAMMTPQELAQERVDEAKRLRDSGLLSDAEYVKESERAAASMRQGQFGAPSAEKGSAAAREASIMAGKQDEQLRVQREMARHLRRMADKKAVEFELVSDR